MGNLKVYIAVGLVACVLCFGFNPHSLCFYIFFFQENKSDEDDNLPSMESLEISKKSSIKQIPSYMGAEDDDDIPDMADFDDNCNVIENDPVS